MIAGTRHTKDAGNDFAAFVADASVTECLVPVLAERGWPLDCVSTGGIEMAIRTLGASHSPRVLVVDLSSSSDPLADINALAEVCEPGTSVIAIGDKNDVTLYRSLVESGVLDYFVKPVAPDDFRSAIHMAEQAMRPHEEATPASANEGPRTIAVIGVRGGTGASLIASTAAWIIGNEFGRSAALLDLDIHFGTAALTFDLEPGRGLVDALSNPSRVDSLFIERAVIKESDKFSILSAEAALGDATQPDPAALSHLLTEVKRNYQTVLIDLPRHMSTQYPFLLAECSDILLVTDMTLASTRDAIRLLGFIKDHAPQAQVRLAVNRLGINGLVEVEQKDFEAAIERKIDFLIPNDPKSVVTATKRGKPLPVAAASSKLVQSIHSLSVALNGIADRKMAEPFWKKFVAIGKK
ncbi:AAA family ATPase [Govanella unica]|uniref:Pilus assembly protein CpaE n=1 Tax=Govanella unica TaxID=2975056 RepID=A0A9X3U026_9PROT|nr:cellulose synthase operon protein YhjQ/BcsQ [Govania unica]MDA5194968.1 pilus assembly protein CpaE [Govania unica]